MGVSIMAQSRIFSGACKPCKILATLMTSPGCATFGTRIASGAALQAASRSSVPHGVSSALIRMTISRPPLATALDSGTHPIAGERLCVRRNGVFKVQDQGICGDGLGLFEGSFVRARHMRRGRPCMIKLLV
jgi:hypothetical protein